MNCVVKVPCTSIKENEHESIRFAQPVSTGSGRRFPGHGFVGNRTSSTEQNPTSTVSTTGARIHDVTNESKFSSTPTTGSRILCWGASFRPCTESQQVQCSKPQKCRSQITSTKPQSQRCFGTSHALLSKQETVDLIRDCPTCSRRGGVLLVQVRTM